VIGGSTLRIHNRVVITLRFSWLRNYNTDIKTTARAGHSAATNLPAEHSRSPAPPVCEGDGAAVADFALSISLVGRPPPGPIPFSPSPVPAAPVVSPLDASVEDAVVEVEVGVDVVLAVHRLSSPHVSSLSQHSSPQHDPESEHAPPAQHDSLSGS